MIALLSLTACGGRITPEDFNTLAKTCDNNGGLLYMDVSSDSNYGDIAVCKNNVQIQRAGLKTEGK